MGERNPNYMTPEEALKKICPLKATSDIDDVSGQCVSHECMAWHWHEYQIPVLGNEGPVVWQKEVSMTYGRCGMVPMMPVLERMPE